MVEEGRNTKKQQHLRSAHALFEGERLTLARLSNGLKKSELAHKVGVTPAAIGQYERGKIRPSSETILRLSSELKFPAAFFEQGRRSFAIRHEEAHFRHLRSTTKTERSRVLARAELLMELVEELEKYLNIPAVDLPEGISIGKGSAEEIEKAAELVRENWGLNLGPIDNMVRLLERHGCVVTRLAKGDSSRKIDAFSTWMGLRPVIILSSEKDKVTRWRFDAAHELGHLVMHQDAEPGSLTIEKQAHRFAAAFLMPRRGIANSLPRRVYWPDFIHLKKKWGVALSALLRRSRDLGFISEDQYRRGMIQYNRNGWREDEPGDQELNSEAIANNKEQPMLFHKAIEMLEQHRGVTQEDLANNLRITVGLLQDLSPSPTQEKVEIEL
jgi:Zn-dependent peptidase ImmA (M78 family)/plasmid maintenance system antidote protein VapI